MKRYSTIRIIAIILTGSFSKCVDDKGLVTHGITMTTPNGEKLKSVEEGPVRSALGVPVIDLTTFQLTIGGLVDSSYSLSWEEIKELPAAFTDTILMHCVEGWEIWGVWKGVLIKDLLDKAHVHSDGEFVQFRCRDGYQTALPISYLEKYNAMLAFQGILITRAYLFLFKGKTKNM